MATPTKAQVDAYNLFQNQATIDSSSSVVGTVGDFSLWGIPEGYTRIKDNLYYSYSAYQKLLDSYLAEQKTYNANRQNAAIDYRTQLAKYNEQKAALNLDISATQGILDQLANNFSIDQQLLNRQQAKRSGLTQTSWGSSGFGSQGMGAAIQRDLELQSNLEQARLKADNDLQTAAQQNKIKQSQNSLNYLQKPSQRAIATPTFPTLSFYSPQSTEQLARSSGIAWGWEGTSLLRGGFTF